MLTCMHLFLITTGAVECNVQIRSCCLRTLNLCVDTDLGSFIIMAVILLFSIVHQKCCNSFYYNDDHNYYEIV